MLMIRKHIKKKRTNMQTSKAKTFSKPGESCPPRGVVLEAASSANAARGGPSPSCGFHFLSPKSSGMTPWSTPRINSYWRNLPYSKQISEASCIPLDPRISTANDVMGHSSVFIRGVELSFPRAAGGGGAPPKVSQAGSAVGRPPTRLGNRSPARTAPGGGCSGDRGTLSRERGSTFSQRLSCLRYAFPPRPVSAWGVAIWPNPSPSNLWWLFSISFC